MVAHGKLDETCHKGALYTFGVLIGECRTISLHHGLGGEVLRGDEFQAAPLPILLLLNEVVNLGVLNLQGPDQALILTRAGRETTESNCFAQYDLEDAKTR